VCSRGDNCPYSHNVDQHETFKLGQNTKAKEISSSDVTESPPKAVKATGPQWSDIIVGKGMPLD
jgi:hypothetical protein